MLQRAWLSPLLSATIYPHTIPIAAFLARFDVRMDRKWAKMCVPNIERGQGYQCHHADAAGQPPLHAGEASRPVKLSLDPQEHTETQSQVKSSISEVKSSKT